MRVIVLNLAFSVLRFLVAVIMVFPALCVAAPKISVGVSILPQKYFVTQIGGENVEVIVMVGAGSSPETYEPIPRQLTLLEQAKLYFLVGVPVEKKWQRLFSEINPNMKIISLADGINLRKFENVNMLQRVRLIQDGGNSEARDPHFWLNPKLAKIAARRIKDALIDVDPVHSQIYQSNFQKLIVNLDQLDREIRNKFSSIKNRYFMVMHPSWGYFADAYRLAQIPIEVQGKQPGAKSMAGLIKLAKEKNIKVIFAQPQINTRNVLTFAKNIGAKLVTVDPLAEDYIANLNHVASLFREAML